MRTFVRLWLVTAVSYVVARYGVQVLAAGIWRIEPELLSHIVLVPLFQVAVLMLLRLLRLRLF